MKDAELLESTLSDLHHYQGRGEQAELRETLLRFLTTEPAAFDRRNPAGRITASAVVLDPENARVLLHRSRKLGRWVQLGGHCEDDATLLGAAHREAEEESGLTGLRAHPGIVDLDIFHFTLADGTPSMVLDVRYLVTGDSALPLTVSPEAWELQWWPLDGLSVEVSVRRAVQEAGRRLELLDH